MKEKYEKPKAELEEFKTLDVISTSEGGDDSWIGPPAPWG